MNEKQLSKNQKVLLAIRELKARLKELEYRQHEPIAIVGMGCRFPGGVNNPDEFWRLLSDEVDVIEEIPRDRWNIDALFDPNPEAKGKMYTRWGGFLKDIDQFDPLFFGISPREAASLDPQQRLLLEVAWEALENAGQNPKNLKQTQSGVFIGITASDYAIRQIKSGDLTQIDAHFGTGSALNAAAGRISYVLGLQGPSMVVDTACSSSLVAIHLACQSLRSGESQLALAGGVNLILSPESTITTCQAKMMSPVGRCKTFDALADGYVRGEGCGLIVLKRLSEAEKNHDPVLAVIRGSAVNQDGQSAGLTVPNGLAQQALIREALEKAGVNASQVSYIEAHGTGTALGDPIEIGAINQVFGQGRDKTQKLLVGSVKTNIGHLESAAGVAGIIKTVLALQKGEIPSHLHFKKINPHIPIHSMPLEIPTQKKTWQTENLTRIAGVSSFGFSGTNAHVILEEASVYSRPGLDNQFPQHLLTLSAKNEESLQTLAKRYIDHFSSPSRQSWAEICFTTNTGRTHFPYRLAIQNISASLALEQLQAFTSGEIKNKLLYQQSDPKPSLKTVFLFTGQGSQYIKMGEQLYQTQPVFQFWMDECDRISRPLLDFPLLSVIYGENSQQLDQTAYTQPALFALEYALFKLWESWGVTPDAVIGHSIGEYVAACVAGVFGLEDGLRLVVNRGKLMQSLPAGGEMAAIFADENQVSAAIENFNAVSIATINAPGNTVISGPAQALTTILERLSDQGVKSQKLTVSHAFHSPLMDPILDRFEAVAATIKFQEASIPLISNVSGKLADPKTLCDPKYWREHIREAVRFFEGMRTLAADGFENFIELGPSPILTGAGKQCLPENKGLWLVSLRRGREDWSQILESLGNWYVKGGEIDWDEYYRDIGPYFKQKLPTYPFNRQRYWKLASDVVETTTNTNQLQPIPVFDSKVHPLLGQRLRAAHPMFESELKTSAIPFMKDHRIFDTVLFPFTAFLEIAHAIQIESVLEEDYSLVDINVLEPLVFPDEQHSETLQSVLTPGKKGAYHIRVYSLKKNETEQEPDSWQLHAEMCLARDQIQSIPFDNNAIDLKAISDQCSQSITADLFYQNLKKRGLGYGKSFQGIKKLRIGKGMALGRIESLSQSGAENIYQLHPAFLDACFQVLIGTLLENEITIPEGEIYLPVTIDKCHFNGVMGDKMWCYATLEQFSVESPGRLSGNIYVLDDAGQIKLSVIGLTCKRVSRQMFQQLTQSKLRNWLYQTRWELEASPEKTLDPNEEEIKWLIFADQSGLGESVSKRLEGKGDTTVLVYPGTQFESVNKHIYRLDPKRSEDFERLIKITMEQDSKKRWGFLHFWSLDIGISEQMETKALGGYLELTCGSVLHLVQQLQKTDPGKFQTFCLITKGAQAIDEQESAMAPSATLWGFGRVIANEYPGLNCKIIDWDFLNASDHKLLFEEIQRPRGSGTEQVAFRNDSRYVCRLIRYAPIDAESSQQLKLPQNQPFRLDASSYGTLSNLELQPISRLPLKEGEIEIEVKAAGLNFRDVMTVMGLYPGEPGMLGAECAGLISAVGKGVSKMKVGDTVIAIAPGSLGVFVTTAAELVIPKPPSLTFEEAATMLNVFLSTYYPLHHLAKISKGDKILIHAAAGGVGLAAIQIAQKAGAEIFATAGKPFKRRYLESLGVQHVLDSRSLDFASEITKQTGLEEIDIVLNSLAGDYISKSFSVLKRGGRFIELGKIGIWSEEQVTDLNKDISYFPIAIDRLAQEDPKFVGEILNQLAQLFEKKTFKPLPRKVFAFPNAIDAFRMMQKAEHIGKIVLVPEARQRTPSPEGDVVLQADAAYLITGGLGALGLLVAEWMVDHGARHITLLGRNGPSELAKATIEKLESQDVTITVSKADVADIDQLTQAMSDVLASDLPLRGVIHSAGLLDDGAIGKQDWERFSKVLSPKVLGAWNLHILCRFQSLDFFILFSSVSALLGTPGQANYAAANTFLDALAHYRQNIGLPALSINWGAWSEIGMAADKKVSDNRFIKGIELIPPKQGLEILNKTLGLPQPQIMVFPVNWTDFAGNFAQADIPKLFSHFMETAKKKKIDSLSVATDGIWQRLKAADPEKRTSLLQTHLTARIAEILGWAQTDTLNPKESLLNLGLDSLMAVELKNIISMDFGSLSIPDTLLLEYPNIEALTEYLSKLLLLPEIPVIQIPKDAQEVSQPAPAKNVTAQEPVTPKVPIVRSYPLSHAQQGLWYLYNINPGMYAYNLTIALRILSPLDLSVLQSVFEKIVDRHPALRTRIVVKDGEPWQHISETLNTKIKVIEAFDLPEKELQDRVRLAARGPFDLEKGPLVRLTVYTSKNAYVLLIVVHHIIFDGTSTGVMLEELIKGYTAEKAGQNLSLPIFPLQFSDYVQTQAEMLSGARGQILGDYWRNKLSGELPLLNLPLDFPRPPVRSYRGESLSFTIDEELILHLKALCRQEECTLFMLFVAVFQVLLYRYSGQSDILIGSPVAGRNQAEFQKLIGHFINVIILRGDLSKEPDFRRFLRQVKQTVIEALRHQDYPFPLLVETLNVPRSSSITPIFQAALAFQSEALGLFNTDSGFEMGELKGESFPIADQEGELDLTLEVFEKKGTSTVRLKYNPDIFKPETMTRMAGHFVNLLKVIVTTPDQSVSTINLISHQERKQLLEQWNNQKADYPLEKSISQVFEEQAAKVPLQIAIDFDRQQMTYQELNAKANQLAHHLIDLDVGPDVVVGVFMDRSTDMITAILGILKAGGAYLPIDVTYPDERIKHILEDSNIKLVCARNSSKQKIEILFEKGSVVDVSAPEVRKKALSNPINRYEPGHLAYVIYTSGSTGKPKGVMVEHPGFINMMFDQIQGFGVTASDRCLQFASNSFDVSVFEIFLPLFSGGTLVLVASETVKDGLKLIRYLEEKAVTIAALVPSYLKALDQHPLPSLKTLIVGGEPANPKDVKFYGKNKHYFNAYGPTEVSVCASYYLVDASKNDGDHLPIGKPIPNTAIYILDTYLNPVPIGIQGEICVSGPGVARGYLNRPDLTDEKFIPNPFKPGERIYKTGDIGRWLPDGNIEFLGRVDHQVKIRGFRIEIREIETALLSLPEIENAVVIEQENRGDKQLVAFLTSPDRKTAISVKNLKIALSEQLPDYMIPVTFQFLEKFPYISSGKIDLNALRRHTGHRKEIVKDAPETEIQKRLLKIWRQVLDKNEVGMHDNFFDMGGDSLLAIHVTSGILKAFNRELPLSVLLKNQTIYELALFLQEEKTANTESAIVQIQSKGKGTPIFCVHGAGGNVLCYQPLAEKLGHNREFIGIQSLGLVSPPKTVTTVPEMAKLYLSEIRTKQKQGPYIIAGWCMGGCVALEIAQILKRDNEEVNLILIDSYLVHTKLVSLWLKWNAFRNYLANKRPFQTKQDDIEKNRVGNEFSFNLKMKWRLFLDFVNGLAELNNKPFNLSERQLKGYSVPQRISHSIRELNKQQVFPLPISEQRLLNEFQVFENNVLALLHYVPKPYDDNVLLITASKKYLQKGMQLSASHGFSSLCSQLEVKEVSGNHFSVLNDPNVNAVASIINNHLKSLKNKSQN